MSFNLRSDAGGSSGALAINGVDQLVVNGDGSLVAAQNPAAGTRTKRLATMQMFSDEFGSSLGTNGYQRLPSGLIIQWGQIGDGSSATVDTVINGTFPIAFPNACCSITATIDSIVGASASNWGCYARPTSVSGFTVVMDMDSSTAFNKKIYWMAIGY